MDHFQWYMSHESCELEKRAKIQNIKHKKSSIHHPAPACSDIGSTKSESLIHSVSNAMVTRYPMSEPDENEFSQRSRSTKSLRRNKSTFSLGKSKAEEEDEESLTQ